MVLCAYFRVRQSLVYTKGMRNDNEEVLPGLKCTENGRFTSCTFAKVEGKQYAW